MEMNEETLQQAVAALGEHLLDRDWRLRNLYWITDKQGRRVRFAPNWAQVELFDSLSHRNVDLKVRQLGVTTGYSMLWLDAVLFNRDLRVGIVAHTKDDARLLFRDKIKFAYENLPEELRRLLPAVKCDANELLLKNGSGIRVGVTFRSGTVQVLHVTEYGYVCTRNPQRAEEIRTGAFQAVPAGGIIVVESTAKGRAGHFFELCQEAQKGEDHSNGWRFAFLPWYRAPEYATDAPGVEYARETEYLDRLEETAQIALTPAQRQWWCRKRRELGDEMYSEYPSTPEEAFRQSTEGAYYGSLMMEAWKDGRITAVPVDKALLVDTWWDLGINDETLGISALLSILSSAPVAAAWRRPSCSRKLQRSRRMRRRDGAEQCGTASRHRAPAPGCSGADPGRSRIGRGVENRCGPVRADPFDRALPGLCLGHRRLHLRWMAHVQGGAGALTRRKAGVRLACQPRSVGSSVESTTATGSST